MGGVLPEKLPRAELERLQSERLAALLRQHPADESVLRPQVRRGRTQPPPTRSPADLKRLPFTTKAELVADQAEHPPYGSNLTYPLDRYCRLHQTSGTSGRPLRWLDTPESWAWALDCWAANFRFVGLAPGRPAVLPVFVRAVPRLLDRVRGGGETRLSVPARRRDEQHGPAAFPAGQRSDRRPLHADLCPAPGGGGPGSKASIWREVRCGALIVAGEPGGSIPATRQRIEAAWGARVFDHSGMTEIGPVTAECVDNPGGLHVLETALSSRR